MGKTKRRVMPEELATLAAIDAHPEKRMTSTEVGVVIGEETRKAREILKRLEVAEWVLLELEDGNATVLGRPLKRFFTLTEEGETALKIRNGTETARFEDRQAAVRSSPRRGSGDLINTAFGVVLLRQLLAAGPEGRTLNQMATASGVSTATAYSYAQKLVSLGWTKDDYCRNRDGGKAGNIVRLVSLTELGRAEAERRVAATNAALGGLPVSKEALDARHPVPEGHEAGIWMLVRMTERGSVGMSPKEQVENLRDCIELSLGCPQQENVTILVEPVS